jgi:hypothetical protein
MDTIMGLLEDDEEGNERRKLGLWRREGGEERKGKDDLPLHLSRL